MTGRSLYAAVFESLPAGTYTLWHDDVGRTRGATIAGGVVAELDRRTTDHRILTGRRPGS